ncbi:hypothetical protein [Halomonas elongata]|uniref:hypothetical protein n=1 Tax=Halomonas elongata TaxID=2746 RepID=UPI00186B6D17|nr:hypothetical protein [Halomonas elongata]MBW5802046.1 hypothetical protein [Halomonas elongata]
MNVSSDLPDTPEDPMPSRSGGRYEIRDGEPVLVSRTQPPQPTSTEPAPAELPVQPAPVDVSDEQEDADDADA